jgi:hypothetical protein
MSLSDNVGQDLAGVEGSTSSCAFEVGYGLFRGRLLGFLPWLPGVAGYSCSRHQSLPGPTL